MRPVELMRSARLPVASILHIGANDGCERQEYLASGASPCIYVEPIDAVYARLQSNLGGMPGHIAVQAICTDRSGETVDLNIASNSGESSSLFALGTHSSLFPEIRYTGTQRMKSRTVDDLLADIKLEAVPNLLVIDTQGAELKVLQGACQSLEGIDGVFAEVSELPLYDGSCVHEEITGFLKPFGLRLRWMALNADGYGDAFYCREKPRALDLPIYGGNLALNRCALRSSTSQWSNHDARGATNGQRTGGFGFHTADEVDPWWQVDLGTRHDLREVRVYNRLDTARHRSRTMRVLVSVDGKLWALVHDQKGQSFGGVDGRPLRVLLSNAPARYVRLQLNERTYFHLDEVEIY